MFGEEMARVFEDMYYEAGWVGFAVGLSHMGQRDTTKDVSVTTDYTDQVPWGGWTPGDPDVAKKLIGDANAPGLKNLLDNRYVTIKGIEQTRYTELANILSRGAARGDSTGTVATAIDRWVGNLPNDPNNPTPEALVRLGTTTPWNEMVARTEIRSATTAASLDSYRDGGLKYVEWLTADGGCPICAEYEAMGSVDMDEGFGDIDGPPAHPNCLCVILPVTGQVVESGDAPTEDVPTEDEAVDSPVTEELPNDGPVANNEEFRPEPTEGEPLHEDEIDIEQFMMESEQLLEAETLIQDNYSNEFNGLGVYEKENMTAYVASLSEGASRGHLDNMKPWQREKMELLFAKWQRDALPKYIDTASTAVKKAEVRRFANRMFKAHPDQTKWAAANKITEDTGSPFIKELRNDLQSYTSSNRQKWLNTPTVQEAMSHAPTYVTDVHRGIQIDPALMPQFRQLKEGDIFPNKEKSTSFSTDEQVARRFSHAQYRPEEAVMVHMNSITGISVAPFSSFHNEYEIVTNSIFRITKVETRSDGVLHLYVTEVRK
jgi:hypothetical protein